MIMMAPKRIPAQRRQSQTMAIEMGTGYYLAPIIWNNERKEVRKPGRVRK